MSIAQFQAVCHLPYCMEAVSIIGILCSILHLGLHFDLMIEAPRKFCFHWCRDSEVLGHMSWTRCRRVELSHVLASVFARFLDFLIYFLINRTLSWSKWWRAFTCRGASQRLEGVIMCRLCALLCNYVCTKCTCAAAACAMAAMVFVCTQFGLGTGVPTLITSHFGSCFKNWMKHSMCGCHWVNFILALIDKGLETICDPAWVAEEWHKEWEIFGAKCNLK